MHLSELFGRVIKVNLTKPSKLRENMNKPSKDLLFYFILFLNYFILYK